MTFVLFWSRFFTSVSVKYFIISVVVLGKKAEIIKAFALHTIFIGTNFMKVCIVLRTNRKAFFCYSGCRIFSSLLSARFFRSSHPEVFYRDFLKFFKICRKAPVLECLLVNVTCLQVAMLLKIDSVASFFLWFLQKFQECPLLQNFSGWLLLKFYYHGKLT